MGPIAVVCLMLLWPGLGWTGEPAQDDYKPGERSCIYDGKGQIIVPGELPIHHLQGYVLDCLKRQGTEPSKDNCQELRPNCFWCGGSDKPPDPDQFCTPTRNYLTPEGSIYDNPDTKGIELGEEIKQLQLGGAPPQAEPEKLAIETAKMVGFELVAENSSQRMMSPGTICLGPLCAVQLTAKCFPYPTDTDPVAASIPCQVYAEKTGKIMNLECRHNGCMVIDVLDIHR